MTHESPLTSNERAAKLFDDALKNGSDHPSEAAIASAINDAEADALNHPDIMAARHGGQRAWLDMALAAAGSTAADKEKVMRRYLDELERREDF